MNRPWLAHYDRNVPQTINYPDETVPQILDWASEAYGNKPYLNFHNQSWTYREVLRKIDHLARALIDLGLTKGERVALCLPNTPDFVISFFAILRAGGVVVAVNPFYKYPEIYAQVQDTGAQYLIGLPENQLIYQKVAETTSLRKIIFAGKADGQDLEDNEQGSYTIERLIQRRGERHILLPRLLGDDAAIFQFSGGTTGIPKAAVGLHKNLAANARQFRHWLVDFQDGNEKVLLAIPLYHVYGMVLGVCVGTLLGAELILQPDPRDTQAILSQISEKSVSFFPAVPTLLQALLRDPGVTAGKYRLSSLRACISGSAPLHPEVCRQFERLTGANVMEGYGLSEAPTATHCNPMLGEKRDGSIGLPLPDVDCRIASLEDGITEMPVGKAGELLIRGPQVMAGYYNQPEESAAALRDGWLHTGDIARMDAEGYFYLVDRKKDLIKVGGLQVWPREIEEVLMTHPAVGEAAVAGIPDAYSGERAKAWIVLKSGWEVSAQELSEWCAEKLSGYTIPREVEFVPALPRTPVGKVLRRELVRGHIQRQKDKKTG